ncbi:MAG: Stealth CR1 domain-containing protein, partial [Candidatus Cloacimonetes bacterium]|nr:Stealth CR1 domain-containing protein [Candidatus Cloacimonadota bacterium]
HILLHEKYDILVARGSVLPILQITENPYHYSPFDKEVPFFGNFEGNVSYKADVFYEVKGWDDDIQMGHGGKDICIRIFNKYPDYSKQIYSPLPLLYHEFTKDSERQNRKQVLQAESAERLSKIHPNWNEFWESWDEHRADTVTIKETFNPEISSNSEPNLLWEKLKEKKWTYKYDLYQKVIDSITKIREVENPKLSVIISSVTAGDMMLSCLHRLKYQTTGGCEIIFINSGGSDSLFDAVSDLADTYIKLNNNACQTMCRNIGAVYASSDILLFLDDDCLPKNDLIKNHITMHKTLDVISVRGKSLPITEGASHPREYNLGDKSVVWSPDLESNSSFNANVFFEVGGWCDDMEGGYAGKELSYRLLQKYPNHCQQIYSPLPCIYQDYENKYQSSEAETYAMLNTKYPDWASFEDGWTPHIDDPIPLKNDKLHNPSNPFISFCIPTFDNAHYLKDAVDSIIAQPFTNYEILICDDGSTDDTSAVVERIISENSDKNIRYIRKAHEGIPKTRNRMIAEAKGEWIFWVDSDDILFPNVVGRYVDFIKHYPDVNVFYGTHRRDSCVVYSRRTKGNKVDFYRDFDFLLSMMVYSNAVKSTGTCVKKMCYHVWGLFDTEYEMCSDYEFWTRNMNKATFKHIKSNSLYYRFQVKDPEIVKQRYRKQQSYKSRILARLLDEFTLPELFPLNNWNNEQLSSLYAYFELARLFTKRLHRAKALEYYNMAFGILELEKTTDMSKIHQMLAEIFEEADILEHHQASIINLLEIEMFDHVDIDQPSSCHPLISICIPTYNRADMLSECLESALNQSFENYEIVVVDDGSTDGTEELVAKYLNRADRKIRYIKKENEGIPITRNRLIAESKGDWLLWLDSDDMLFSDVLKTFADFIARYSDVSVFYGNQYNVGENSHLRSNNGIYMDNYHVNSDLLARLVSCNRLPNSGSCVKRELYEKYGCYDTTFLQCEDYELWTRVIEKVHFKHIENYAVYYRVHSANVSCHHNLSHKPKGYESIILSRLIDRFPLQTLFLYLDWSMVNSSRSVAYTEIAKIYALRYDEKKSIEYYNKAFDILGVQKVNNIRELLTALEKAFSDEKVIREHRAILYLLQNNSDMLAVSEEELIYREKDTEITVKTEELTRETTIDLVYLWVDGGDPVWQAKKDDFIRSNGVETNHKNPLILPDDANSKARFACNDELKYSLRSVEKYAPWINQIYIVTDGQTPKWLDTSNSKIKIIDHKDLLNEDCLPCFNSVAIEPFLYKIPGLSEQFLYANDDMLLNKPMHPNDFFTAEGLPVIRMKKRPENVWFWESGGAGSRDVWTHKRANAAKLVYQKFGLLFRDQPHHNIDVYTKSNMKNCVEKLFPIDFQNTAKSHMRVPEDINRSLFDLVAIAEKKCELKYVSETESFTFPLHFDSLYSQFKSIDPTMFCMNDTPLTTDMHREKAKAFLQGLFPGKSQFEKSSGTVEIVNESCDKKPFFSILIPTYNRAGLILETLQSVIEQDYTNYEVVILNDGGTDNTEQVLLDYMATIPAEKANKICYASQANQGVPKTRNNLIKLARSPYLFWLDDDDILYPNILSRYADFVVRYPDVDAFYGNKKHFGFSDDEWIYPDYYGKNELLIERLVFLPKVPQTSLLIKKEVYMKYGGYREDMTRLEDTEIWVRFRGKI